MKISYSSKTGTVTIKLTDAETRQFVSSAAAVEVVREGIHKAKELTKVKSS